MLRKALFLQSGLLFSLAALACGGGEETTEMTDGATSAGTVGTTTPTTDTTNPTTTDGTSAGPGSETDSSSETTDSTTDPSTTDPSTTDPSTTDPSTTDPSTTDPSTTDPSTTDPTEDPTTDSSTTEDPLFCIPGSKSCVSDNEYQECNEEGSDYDPPVPCPDGEGCLGGECLSLCALAENQPSSVGCSFLANRQDNLNANTPDSLVVGNVSDSLTATVQLYFTPNGQNTENAQGAAVQIPPQGTHTFEMTNAQIESVTTVRIGGAYRIESDIPLVAYLHSPIGSQATNDASMLLPEHALTGNYIIASYPGTFPTHYPSYFTAIAAEDDTSVTFTAAIATAGGGGVPALNAGESTTVNNMNRFDTLNVVVSQSYTDLSGTIIESDKPLWVTGASECANVPAYPTTFCDHLEEVSIPLEYWGETYVGAHAPQRGNETYHWRVYSGDDMVTIDTDPQQDGFPVTLDRGEYLQFEAQDSFILTADGPFMPVQYLESQNGGAGTGDPSMYQMVPVEQFLNRYAFVTGTNYNQHYAQITRPVGGPAVFVDGQEVNGYYTVGEFEVADWPVSEGGHFAQSDGDFGITQVGYTPVTSYAYPGGLKLEVINPQ